MVVEEEGVKEEVEGGGGEEEEEEMSKATIDSKRESLTVTHASAGRVGLGDSGGDHNTTNVSTLIIQGVSRHFFSPSSTSSSSSSSSPSSSSSSFSSPSLEPNRCSSRGLKELSAQYISRGTAGR